MCHRTAAIRRDCQCLLKTLHFGQGSVTFIPGDSFGSLELRMAKLATPQSDTKTMLYIFVIEFLEKHMLHAQYVIFSHFQYKGDIDSGKRSRMLLWFLCWKCSHIMSHVMMAHKRYIHTESFQKVAHQCASMN